MSLTIPAIRRLAAAALLIGTVAAGLAVHRGMPASAASDIAGDALYAVAAYLAVVVVMPRWRSLVVGVLALGWCVGIELLQLTSLPLRVAEVLPLAALVLGSGFDARDLLVYTLAVAAAVTIDASTAHVTRSRGTR